jgi:phage terminase large subunit-like protein
MNSAEKYIEEVITGKVKVCELTRMAVMRHVEDLETGVDRGLFFDKKAGEKAINFFKQAGLKHTKGEFAKKSNTAFIPEPWQCFILYVLFGWKNADGSRRFNYAYVEVAKKNGKSTFAAGIAHYCFIADKEPGAEVYTAASNRDQAKIVFNEARNMVRNSTQLKKLVTVYEHSLFVDVTMSTFKPLSADQDSFEGKNPSCTIFDEYHVQKTNDLFDNIKSAMASRKSPLLFIITTAGKSRTSPCYDYRQMVIEILKGVKNQDNIFGLIYTLDEGDQWDDPEVWIKSNPNLDVSVNRSFLENELKECKNRESAVINFKTKNLNIWTDSSKGWIADKVWMACASEEVTKEKLIGMSCYGGLDLAASTDLNSLSLYFPEIKAQLWWFWIPEGKVAQVEDRVDYRLWVQQGWIKITEGDVIDIDTISADIVEIVSQYNVASIAIDPARAYHGVVQNLQKEDITLSHFRQGFVSMDTPTKEFERLIVGKELRHEGNPVMRWNMGNIEIRTDPAGNIKIDKGKSRNRVDGPVAGVMAIGEYMTNSDNNLINEIYANEGIKTT